MHSNHFVCRVLPRCESVPSQLSVLFCVSRPYPRRRFQTEFLRNPSLKITHPRSLTWQAYVLGTSTTSHGSPGLVRFSSLSEVSADLVD